MKTAATVPCAALAILALLGGCTGGHGIVFDDDGAGGAREVAVTRALVGVGEVVSASGAESSSGAGGATPASSGAGGAGGGGVDAGGDTLTACAHDACSGGVALDATCDPSVASTCAIEPSCCAMAWDVSCMAEVAKVRGEPCASGAACTHSMCVTGAALVGAFTDACALPVYRVCNPGDGDMPECCEWTWSQACVDAAIGWGAICG